MKTKIMQFIASLLENWRDEKQLPKDRPEIIPVQSTPVIEQQTKPASAALTKPTPVSLTEHVNAFLQSTYDFRYNLLTEETEYRPAGKVGEGFSPVGKRELNTLCFEAHAQGIACWDKDISRYLYSTCVPGYHPFHLYMDELPAWDGIDRLEALARRVSPDPLWLKDFHIWLLALTAQWLGMTGKHANSVAPVLVSAKQGFLKSTFCKCLMPDCLSRYYSDEVELTSKGNVTRKMSEMGLLNLDEFDKYSASKMPLLKNLMQMADLNLCKAYQRNYRNLPRIASFIGTSNRFDLLADPTGSRRFLCIEVKGKIDCSHIEHKQIYAQLKQELLTGARYWFTAEEECELQEHNRAFQRCNLMEELLHSCFRPSTAEDQNGVVLHLSAADIFKVLKKQNPAAMRGINPNAFAQQLAPLGFPRSRSRYGNYYSVVSLSTTPSTR